MSFQVPTYFVDQFTTNVEMLLQERGGKMREAVETMSHTGRSAVAVEQVGPVKARRVTTRHDDSPLISTPADRRWLHPVDYDWGDLVDDEDKLRMLIDPTSSYAQNGANALLRAQTDELLRAFYGDAKTGENGTTTVTFPSSQIVGPTVGSTGNSGLNIAKLRAAKKLLMANHVQIDSDPLYIAITAEQHDDLLNEAQAISLDYNTQPVLVNGRITAFMGFNFIHVEYADTATYDYASQMQNGDGSIQYAPCWARSGMHLGIWKDVQVRIQERADKRFSTYVYVVGTYGATRKEEKKIVRIDCAV